MRGAGAVGSKGSQQCCSWRGAPCALAGQVSVAQLAAGVREGDRERDDDRDGHAPRRRRRATASTGSPAHAARFGMRLDAIVKKGFLGSKEQGGNPRLHANQGTHTWPFVDQLWPLGTGTEAPKTEASAGCSLVAPSFTMGLRFVSPFLPGEVCAMATTHQLLRMAFYHYYFEF